MIKIKSDKYLIEINTAYKLNVNSWREREGERRREEREREKDFKG